MDEAASELFSSVVAQSNDHERESRLGAAAGDGKKSCFKICCFVTSFQNSPYTCSIRMGNAKIGKSICRESTREKAPSAESVFCVAAGKCAREQAGGIEVSPHGRHRYRPQRKKAEWNRGCSSAASVPDWGEGGFFARRARFRAGLAEWRKLCLIS